MAKAGPRPGRTEGGRDGEAVRRRLIDATIQVLARDGFAHASARAIATEAGGVNGLIFYHFGSMDQLLAATARALTERGLARVREGLGGDRAHQEWPQRLGEVIRAEAERDDGRAVMELLVGCRSSPLLAEEVRAAINQAMAFAAQEVERVVGSSPLARLVPPVLLADLAAAAFLGLEILTQNGRVVDVDQLATTVASGLQFLAAIAPPAPSPAAAEAAAPAAEVSEVEVAEAEVAAPAAPAG